MAPYPSPKEIEAMFEALGPNRGEGFFAHLAEDVRFEVMGADHAHRDAHPGRQHVRDGFFGQFDEWADWSTIVAKCRHVMGGGESSWAAVEMTINGKSKKGKHVHSECVFISNFNTDGKITESRLYLDSAHMHEHLEHHKAN